jgi:hypothetical protein
LSKSAATPDKCRSDTQTVLWRDSELSQRQARARAFLPIRQINSKVLRDTRGAVPFKNLTIPPLAAVAKAFQRGGYCDYSQ